MLCVTMDEQNWCKDKPGDYFKFNSQMFKLTLFFSAQLNVYYTNTIIIFNCTLRTAFENTGKHIMFHTRYAEFHLKGKTTPKAGNVISKSQKIPLKYL